MKIKIDPLDIIYIWGENKDDVLAEKIVKTFPQIFNYIKEGKWYKDHRAGNEGSYIFIKHIIMDEEGGPEHFIEEWYGFNKGVWESSSITGLGYCDLPYPDLVEVTKKEFKNELIPLFKHELLKRYGEEWENLRIKEGFNFDEVFGSPDVIPLYESEINIKDDEPVIWNRFGRIFYGGKWAELYTRTSRE